MFGISSSGFNSSGGTGSALMLTLVAFSWIPVAAGYVGFGLYPSNSPLLDTTAILVIKWKIFQYKIKKIVDISPESDSHVFYNIS